ncbi:hypothetical protein FQN50_003676 [Emmonsiellopsis sp. PD_5]|nr:hypothetical protein FQN50_003676 [Emmonsiellopsis sp. PD_5]
METAGQNTSLIERTVTSAQSIFSKQAQRAYVNTILFALSSLLVLCVSVLAYILFYYNYIPQIGLERQVHLQFGDGHPYGTASLGSSLVSAQQYDVSVSLHLPRTPSNLAAGNFMLDLSLYSQPSSSSSQPATTEPILPSKDLIVRSRRPAILTYASSLVDTGRRISRMPFYVFGWKREAERVKVVMMERVEFAKGRGKEGNIPAQLRLEIQSPERMQVYSAVVRFDARFSGLRWIMYNWRILSFVIFTSTFWFVSMICTSSVWIALANQEEPIIPTIARKPKLEAEEEGDASDSSIKEESEDEGHDSSRLSLRRERRASSEADRIKKEENIEESTMIQPLVGEGETEVDPSPAGASTGADSERPAQRRRGHIHFEDEEVES